MPRHFVLAFGGTGARCAEAFTYLVAARALAESCHVLIVDPDQNNGNVSNARRQLQRYSAIHDVLSPAADGDDRPFFPVALNEGRRDFFWANPSAESRWGQSIGYQTRNAATRALLDLLYDEDDLELSFEQGYIGRAHIGSLDLLRALEGGMRQTDDAADGTKALQHFAQSLRNAVAGGARANLIVFASVFGGTGASGLPIVPSLVSSVLGAELRERVTIACALATPYFVFPKGAEGDQRSPDSAAHPLATETALRHYATADIGYDRIYLVGAPDRPTTSQQNRPGGSSQKNEAHYAELAAALAAIDVFGEHATRPSGATTEHVTRLFASSANVLDWSKFPGAERVQARRQLVSLATFLLWHADYMAEVIRGEGAERLPWMRVLAKRPNRRLAPNDPVLGELTDFARRYAEWIYELQSHTSDALFTLDRNVRENQFALGAITAGGDAKRRDPNRVLTEHLTREGENGQESGAGFYLHALTRTVDRYVRENYASWLNER